MTIRAFGPAAKHNKPQAEKRMGKSDVHPGWNFEPWQVWPGSYDNPGPQGDYPLPEGPRPRIGPGDPITVLGSCFIRELKTRLERAGYNLLREEEDDPAGIHASAAWERFYNTFSLRQIVEYSLEEFAPEIRWWRCPVSGQIQDPYRRVVLYPSLDQAEAGFKRHRQAARRALTSARFLLISLDYIEIWEDVRDKSVICLPSGPYVTEGGDMSRYRFRVSGMEENLANLRAVRAMLDKHNPECRIIAALSPIHQWVTFRPGMDVFSASCLCKSVLREAADLFCRESANAHYFPAFEMASLQLPLQGRECFAKGRENFHVDQAGLDWITKQFSLFYGDEG